MALNDEIMPFMLKGMLASRHHKQRSSSLIKEPTLLKCQCNHCIASTKTDKLFDVYSQADATDADVIRKSLDPTLFPGVSSSIGVHSGFANEQAKYVKCSFIENFF